MSLTLLPCDGKDLSLLLRAGVKASSTTLRQLNHDRIRSLVEREGIELATALLYERTKREHHASTHQIDALYHNASVETQFHDVAFVYVPNLGFFADPSSQAVGNTICQVAEGFGCRSYIAPTSATLSLEANAQIVNDQLAAVQERTIFLASVSKGSADVKMALRQPNASQVFGKVAAWIDALGLSDGSPMVNVLAVQSDRQLERRIERWFRARGVTYVREVLAATKQLGYGRGYPLDGPLEVPAHISRLNVVGFPTARHFRFRGSREFHEAIAAYGPNDGYGILRDMVLRPGMVYPIWGIDHYFEAHLDVKRLATALLVFMATRNSQDRAKVPSSQTRPVRETLAEGADDSRGAPRCAARESPRGGLPDAHDWERLRHARATHDGFAVGRYLQPPPMIFTRDGHNLFLADMYRGHTAFLIGGGPSLANCDLHQLDQRGIVTCGMNNTAALHRPQLWVSVDDPGNFVDAIWKDAGILKFVPLCHMEKHFMERNQTGDLAESEEVIGDMPTVFGYRRNEHFREEQWLYEDTFNWGNHSNKTDSDGIKGSRSVMYVAIRLLFYLGIRRLHLVGCDFRMEQGRQNYAFPQDRSASSVRGNNESYYALNQRLARLRPYFEREGFEVSNCTPDSGLTAFPYLPFDLAIQEAISHIPRSIDTVGMYDRQQRERDQRKKVRAKPKINCDDGTAPVSADKTEVVVPESTLVTVVDDHTLDRLAMTWPTWCRYYPQISAMPVIVIHHGKAEPAARHGFLQSHSNLRLISSREHKSDATRMHEATLRTLANEVKTPWYLLIDPNAVATDGAHLLDAAWFTADRHNRLPVLIGAARNSEMPVHDHDDLIRWGNTIAGLSGSVPLTIRSGEGADQLDRSGIHSWWVAADSAWTRELVASVPDRMPQFAPALLLWYWASRRGDVIQRIDLRRQGWSHVTGSDRRLGFRCASAIREREGIAMGAKQE